MAKLSSQQLTELGDNFLAFSQSVGNYRMENRSNLTKTQNLEIKNFHRTLLNYADDLYTTSAKLIMDDIQTSLETIKEVTSKTNDTFHKLKKVQKVLDIAASGVTLGAAIFSKNPQAISDAITELSDNWNG